MFNQIISKYLEINPNQITKITELHYVWCVVVSGKRPVFISKKKVENFAFLIGDDVFDDYHQDNINQIASSFHHFADIDFCKGSEKQKNWADRVRIHAFRSLAEDVYAKRETREDAEKILQNNNAIWWIENRKRFVDY